MIAIAFTGQDGTGKSTQMELLREALEARGLSVGMTHQYGPTTPIGRFLLPLAKKLANRSRAPASTPPADAAPPPGPQRRRGSAVTRHLGATLSLILGWGRALTHRFLYRAVDVLILDRYFSDEIIRARHKFESGARLGSWILRRGVPRPELAIAFTLDSRTGWERKKTRELTLDEYRRKVEIIDETLRHAEGFWNLVTIRVDGATPDDVFRSVWGHVEQHVATSG